MDPNSGIRGLHHITAITANANANINFWQRLMGLRLVKRTVNFDDPGTWHLYYGDETGAPGSLLTFFNWSSNAQRSPGCGEASLLRLSAPDGSLAYYKRLLGNHVVSGAGDTGAFGEKRIIAHDPDGMGIVITERADDTRRGWMKGPLLGGMEIRGLDGVALRLKDIAATQDLLCSHLGYKKLTHDGATTRLVSTMPAQAGTIDLVSDRDAFAARQGHGSIHHVAFTTPDTNTQFMLARSLKQAGIEPTSVMDRKYFLSIYFRSPGGVLFEIATETPGFLVDEAEDALGMKLMLPEGLEPQRGLIEAVLEPLA